MRPTTHGPNDQVARFAARCSAGGKGKGSGDGSIHFDGTTMGVRETGTSGMQVMSATKDAATAGTEEMTRSASEQAARRSSILGRSVGTRYFWTRIRTEVIGVVRDTIRSV